MMLGGKLALRSSWSFPSNFEQHLSNLREPINLSRLSTFGSKEELLYMGDITGSNSMTFAKHHSGAL